MCQITKHVLCSKLKTVHLIIAKRAEHFIRTMIKILAEKSKCHGPNSSVIINKA